MARLGFGPGQASSGLGTSKLSATLPSPPSVLRPQLSCVRREFREVVLRALVPPAVSALSSCLAAQATSSPGVPGSAGAGEGRQAEAAAVR